jgi:hypothetical protein
MSTHRVHWSTTIVALVPEAPVVGATPPPVAAVVPDVVAIFAEIDISPSLVLEQEVTRCRRLKWRDTAHRSDHGKMESQSKAGIPKNEVAIPVPGLANVHDQHLVRVLASAL